MTTAIEFDSFSASISQSKTKARAGETLDRATASERRLRGGWPPSKPGSLPPLPGPFDHRPAATDVRDLAAVESFAARIGERFERY
jgi:hypothetical protein